jgi:hypothetical protein
MHFSTLAAALCLSLPLCAAGFAAISPAMRSDAPGAAAQAAAAPGTGAPATPAPPSDAAAKHAKRTACLKEAKTKKLVGADKTAFIKSCIAAP